MEVEPVIESIFHFKSPSEDKTFKGSLVKLHI